MFVPIRNRFHARQANNKKITILGGYPFLTPACAGFLGRKGSRLKLLKSTFNAEHFTRRFFYLSPAFSAKFTFEIFIAARNREKFTKIFYFGGLKSFKVIDVDIPKKLVASACYNKQYICAYLQPFSRQTRQ